MFKTNVPACVTQAAWFHAGRVHVMRFSGTVQSVDRPRFESAQYPVVFSVAHLWGFNVLQQNKTKGVGLVWIWKFLNTPSV